MSEAIDLSKNMKDKIREVKGRIRENFPADDEWLSHDEACEVIGVNEHVLRTWRRAGFVPHVTFGNAIKYRASICAKVRELRDLHADKWTLHVHWPIGKDGIEFVPSSNFGNDDLEADLAARIIRRGLSLYHEGKISEGAAVLVAAIEELKLISD